MALAEKPALRAGAAQKRRSVPRLTNERAAPRSSSAATPVFLASASKGRGCSGRSCCSRRTHSISRGVSGSNFASPCESSPSPVPLNCLSVGSARTVSHSASSPRISMVRSRPSSEVGATAMVNHRLKSLLRL